MGKQERKAMTEATFTFRVDSALKAEFARAARSRDRTAAQLLRDYMRDYLRQEQAAAHDAWFRREVRAGIEAADAGDVLSAEEVEAAAEAWRAEVRRTIAGAG
jgi:predicted transcriptional regulator